MVRVRTHSESTLSSPCHLLLFRNGICFPTVSKINRVFVAMEMTEIMMEFLESRSQQSYFSCFSFLES